MKLIALISLIASLSPLFAAEPAKKAADPFTGMFFPPELVLMAQDRIALTPGQLEAVRARVAKTQPLSEGLRVKMERESTALMALTKQERVEEAALLAQLDKVLDVEREVKHLQIGSAVAIKNLLTPEQQAKLREIAKDGGKQLDDDVRKRLTAKMERVQAGAQKMAEGGTDPSDILRTMQEKFKPLIDTGKAIEAEAVLDAALKTLGQEPEPTKPVATETKPDASSGSPDEATVKRLTEKVERVKAGARQWAESGRDPSVIGKLMEEKFKPLMAAGKIVEAEAEVDRVLEQLKPGAKSGESPPASPETAQQRVAAKIERIKQGAKKMAESGTDPSPILSTMQEKVGPLVHEGKFAEAEPEVDRVLAQLKADGNSPESAPAPAISNSPSPSPAETVNQRIVAKIERLKEVMKKTGQGGAASSGILKTTEEKVGPLIEAGKFAEAEAELDRVLEQLTKDAK